jgi:predicted permease
VNPEAYAREVEDEMRFHLELEAMQQRAEGNAPDEAAWAARRRFGNVTRAREEVRRMSGVEAFDRIRQNLRYATRGLRTSPGFTAAVVLTLGLGLGVNAAMFSFLDRVFVKPPEGIAAPADVRRLYVQWARDDGSRQDFQNFRYPDVRAVTQTADSATMVGAFTFYHDSGSVSFENTITPTRRGLANANFFRVLGVRPMLGRLFEGLEDRIETSTPVAILSYDLWQRGFNADPHVVGKTFTVNERPFTVVGVAAKGFRGVDLDRTDWWAPLNYTTRPPTTPAWYEGMGGNFGMVTRIPSAPAERQFLAVATRAFRTVHIPGFKYDSTAVIESGPVLSALGPAQRDKSVSVSLRLGGVAFLVLLIAIANVSNLLLVRATNRSREFAVRRALGVTRIRLFEQLLVETLLLAAIAGAASMVLAFWAGTTMRKLLLPDVHWADGPLDVRTILFAAGVTFAVGMVIGLAPSLRAWSSDVVASLKAGARGTGYRRSLTRSTLIVAQAAMSVILLVGAGLFVRSLHNLHAVDLGYDPERTVSIDIRSSNRNVTPLIDAAIPDILGRLKAIPGVQAVATSAMAPMSGFSFRTINLPDRDSLPRVANEPYASVMNVSPGYFTATGLRILAGHDFTRSDGQAVVVGETMAKAWWPGQNPLTRCVILGERTSPCVPVIGVVKDTHRMGVVEPETPAHYFVSDTVRRSTIIFRAAERDQARIERLARQEIQRLVPGANAVRFNSLSSTLEPELRPWKLGATLFSAMGILALLVAAIGVYSVIAYAVSQRANEMGIRIALGARLGDIARLVVGEGLRMIAIGVALGLVASIAGARLVETLLYGVSARDPWTLAAAGLILGTIGVLACVIPALRAGSVDPAEALRMD